MKYTSFFFWIHDVTPGNETIPSLPLLYNTLYIRLRYFRSLLWSYGAQELLHPPPPTPQTA